MARTSDESWAFATEWFDGSSSEDVLFLRSFTLMALVPATAFFYLGAWPVVARVGFALASVLLGYLGISLMMYLLMRAVDPPDMPRVAAQDEATELRGLVGEFGQGLGIARDEWEVVHSTGWTAVAPVPGAPAGSLVTVSVESLDVPLQPASLGFYGRQEDGRLLATTLTHAIFPFKNADIFFDRTISPKALWRQHCDLVGRGGTTFTFDEFVSLHPKANLAKEAGFVRFAMTWGRAVWMQRWFLKGRF